MEIKNIPKHKTKNTTAVGAFIRNIREILTGYPDTRFHISGYLSQCTAFEIFNNINTENHEKNNMSVPSQFSDPSSFRFHKFHNHINFKKKWWDITNVSRASVYLDDGVRGAYCYFCKRQGRHNRGYSHYCGRRTSCRRYWATRA